MLYLFNNNKLMIYMIYENIAFQNVAYKHKFNS